LLAWRRYLVPPGEDPQLALFDGTWAADSDFASPAPPPPAPEPSALSDKPDFREASDAEPIPAEGVAEPLEQPPRAPTPLPDTLDPPTAAADDGAALGAQGDASLGDERFEAVAPLLAEGELAYLRRQVEHGVAILFTGAGFSMAARDAGGQFLPSGVRYAQELWSLCYADEPYDGSTLQDIFERAQRHHNRALNESLKTRFAVDSASLPGWYSVWHEFPWLKAYTINVDDLESAVERRTKLPRPVRTVSALREKTPPSAERLDFIHLNGVAADGDEWVTFSTDQFAKRLARDEPFYAQLAAEMLTRPIVFVGSPLDEPLLWQHIQMRETRARGAESELRPKSFLISPSLNRARADKLRDYNVVWVNATAEAFATSVLESLRPAAERGLATLRSANAAEVGDERNIVQVATASTESYRRTEFLLGEEPSWADIRNGRAITRDEDLARLDDLSRRAMLRPASPDSVPVVAITGTAGCGKTTLLMKIALRLHAEGNRVAWIGAEASVAPGALARYYRGSGRPPIVIIDDAGRYGSQLVPTLHDVVSSDDVRMVILGVRSYHEGWMGTPGARKLAVERQHIGRLTDGDIDRLLGALEREKRLGELRGFDQTRRRTAFRERADRQILVALLEATSGERFEDKVIGEWQSQEPVEQYVYALLALATANGYYVLREEVLLACSGGTRELDALQKLHRSHLLAQDDAQRYRVRHRVIAETLLEELSERGTQLERLVIGLCRALAMRTSVGESRGSPRKRVLKRLLNHNGLLRLLDDTDAARNVYAQLENHLDGDYHFWLQRGCLELEDGDIRHAQNFIEQAVAMNSADPLVETANAHMQLRRAITVPFGPDAEKNANASFETLRRLVVARGASDSYPAHVFGSQALGWCRHATLLPRVRRSLLRDAREIVGGALLQHRGRQELRQLLDDIKREELQAQ